MFFGRNPKLPKQEFDDPSGRHSFEPKPMVRWYDPRQLIGTGLKALLSSVFGAYTDKREIQPNIGGQGIAFDHLAKPELQGSLAGKDEIWVDFTADTGDGFDSTYALAWLMGQPNLKLKGENLPKEGLETPRADYLILGGDLVYPTANREAYKNRFLGPFSSAFPFAEPGTNRPRMFAIPGNHDWYDGLTSFMRLFGQQRTLGGWQTEQNRSYFAIKLTQGGENEEGTGSPDCWLWGIDIQLDTDIDAPQMEYFRSIAFNRMKDGDKVVLCTSEPAWVLYAQDAESRSFERLGFFVEGLIREVTERKSVSLLRKDERPAKRKLDLVAVLTGDLHHYSRYQGKLNGKTVELITSGGGGAFLHPTHNLPQKINLPHASAKDSSPEKNGLKFDQKAVYPSTQKSRKLSLRNLLFPFKNSWFALFFALFYMLFAWTLQSASANLYGVGETLLHQITEGSKDVGEVFLLFGDTLRFSPFSVLLAIILFLGLVLFADRKGPRGKWMIPVGILHAGLHVLLAFFWIWVAATFNVDALLSGFDQATQSVNNWVFTLIFTLEMLIIGGVGGGMVLGVYLVFTNWLFHVHDNEAFSALRIADYKNFLRMKLTKDKLTIYPVAVKKVPRKWRNRRANEVGNARFQPLEAGKFRESLRLIEKPIEIDLKS